MAQTLREAIASLVQQYGIEAVHQELASVAKTPRPARRSRNERLRDIDQLLKQGMSVDEIAAEQGISAIYAAELIRRLDDHKRQGRWNEAQGKVIIPRPQGR
jgi:hypothetical protein